MTDGPGRATPDVGAGTGAGAEVTPAGAPVDWPSRLGVLQAALPVGYLLVLAAAAALGVEGELLSRMLRNVPVLSLSALGAATLGATLPLFALRASTRTTDALASAGAVLLALGVLLGLAAAVTSTRQREQPNITVDVLSAGTAGEREQGAGAAYEAGDAPLQVAVTAAALNLASGDRMLLRVAVYTPDTTLDAARVSCSASPASADLRGNEDWPRPPGAQVLVWQESGAGVSGSSTSDATVDLDPDDYEYLCAHAVLSSQSSYLREGPPRFTTQLLRLSALAARQTDG